MCRNDKANIHTCTHTMCLHFWSFSLMDIHFNFQLLCKLSTLYTNAVNCLPFNFCNGSFLLFGFHFIFSVVSLEFDMMEVPAIVHSATNEV